MSLRRSVTGLLVLAVLVAPAAAAATTPTADRVLVTVQRDRVYLSPDGDGRRDVARVVFDLAARASVTLRIGNEGATAFPDPIHLGKLEAGRHSWTFDGRDAEGHVVPDNDYRIGITAQ